MIVIGAGEVGSSIAEALYREHDVVIIEINPSRCEELQALDVLVIEGNGASAKVLKKARVGEAEIVIACTNIDEINIVACAAAKQLKAKTTIARVQDPEYLETWKKGHLGVDYMVCSELLTAKAIARIISIPEARAVNDFAGGRILMGEFQIKENSPITEIPLSNAGLHPCCTIVSIIRKDKVIIPQGGDLLMEGDRVIAIGTPEAITKFNNRISKLGTLAKVVIIGGGRIGFRLAQILETRGTRPWIIEADEERSKFLAENLAGSLVFKSNGADVEFLERERIGQADVAVSVMESDEKNLLSSLLLKQLGVRKVIARVENPPYVKLFEIVGVDVAINPRTVTKEEIIKYTMRLHAESITLIESGMAEVLEVEASSGKAIGVPLSKANFPKGSIVGAIVRGEQVIIPRGKDMIKPGDKVIIFAEESKLKEVEKLL